MFVSHDPIEILANPDPERARKALASVVTTGFLNVWEGAVRSSKTVVALIAFVHYIRHSPERNFLISGRTMGTIEQNCILGDYGILNMIPGSTYGKFGKKDVITFRVKAPDGIHTIEKHIIVQGASNIGDYKSLRGNSYGGWFADEINMHDREFVAEAFKRTVASRDRRHFWTLNPDNPYHWVYEDYIDYYDQMASDQQAQIGGFHLWKFYLKDNPVLTDQRCAELEMQYVPGSFQYRRAILGERCIAEGLVYPQATEDRVCDDLDPSRYTIRYASIDYGTNHATVMYLGGHIINDRKRWAILGEWYSEKEDLTTAEYWAGFVKLCEQFHVDPMNVNIAIDPSAGAIKVEFQKRRAMAFNAKNDVLDGIDFMRRVLYDGTLKINRPCRQLIRQFSTYSWDEKASERGEDKPIKINDDAVDSARYFAYTHIRPILGG